MDSDPAFPNEDEQVEALHDLRQEMALRLSMGVCTAIGQSFPMQQDRLIVLASALGIMKEYGMHVSAGAPPEYAAQNSPKTFAHLIDKCCQFAKKERSNDARSKFYLPEIKAEE